MRKRFQVSDCLNDSEIETRYDKMDLNSYKYYLPALRGLDVSQNAITGTRRMILTERMDPGIVMQALVEELKYVYTVKQCESISKKRSVLQKTPGTLLPIQRRHSSRIT